MGCAGLGKKVRAAAEAAQANLDTKHARCSQDIYSKEQYDAELSVMDDDQIFEQAGILARGVPMGTPVFDGAREADVISLLDKAGLSNTGQEWLTDGRTGEFLIAR